MTLTLKTLAFMGNLLDDGDFEPNSEDLAELIEYARERAAREACEAAGPKPGLVSLTAIANADDTCRYWAEWSVPFRTLVGVEASTPTNAYLALFAELTK